MRTSPPTQTTQGQRRTALKPLLGLGLLMLAIGTGCATFTVVSEVTRKADGANTGALAVDVEIEDGVYKALLEMDPDSAKEWPMATKAKTSGWTVTGSGRKLRMTRQLSTLPAFQDALPGLAGLWDMGEFPITAMDVTVDEPNDEPPVYEYTATVVIPVQESPEDSASAPEEPQAPAQSASPDDFFGALAGAVASAVDETMTDPKVVALMAAAKKAGPPAFVVGVKLPGSIDEATVNGQPLGVISPDDRVTWTLSYANPGTYSLRAVAHLMKVEFTELAEAHTQGDDFKVRGRVTTKGGSDEVVPVTDAKVDLVITGPKGKPYGTPLTQPLTTDADGYFEWTSYFTADASIGAWKIVATAKKEKQSGSIEREFKVDELKPDVDANIRAIIAKWKAEPSVPNGISQSFIRDLNPIPTYGMRVNIKSWTDSRYEPYTCSALTIKTLKFLNGLRFSTTQSDRLLMGGVHYGPVTDGTGLIHVATALYPSANTTTGWRSGYVLDAWPNQTKESWGWAEWSAMNAGGAEPARFWNFGNMWSGEYPTSGSGGEYHPSVGEIPASIQGAKGTAVLTYSPVALLVSDASGRRTGQSGDGTLVNEIPGADQTLVNLPDGTQASLIALPDGDYNTVIRGTGDGDFHLETTNSEQLLDYGVHPIRSGEEATLKLNSVDLKQALALADGKTVMPSAAAADGGGGLGRLPMVAAIVVGLLAVLGGVVVVVRRGRAH
ncbi:MAG: hypothetical protein IPG72_06370 [Ardenticatenales bacterium]|nr:hypothetical protein [Ardenticatenales bacterium]